jgi:hypothetical protein
MIMKKKIFWGCIVFLSLVMFGACDSTPSASSHNWSNSTWKYEGEADDTITLGDGTLTYTSIRTGKKATLDITIEENGEHLADKTKGDVSTEERILAWIINSDTGNLIIYGIIYCPIEWISVSEKTWEDLEPQKLKILAPEIYANLDMKVKAPFIYIKK